MSLNDVGIEFEHLVQKHYLSGYQNMKWLTLITKIIQWTNED